MVVLIEYFFNWFTAARKNYNEYMTVSLFMIYTLVFLFYRSRFEFLDEDGTREGCFYAICLYNGQLEVECI